MCFYLAWRLWKHISFAEIRPLLIGGALGVPIGVTALTELDPRWIKGSLGVFLVVYSVWSLQSRTPSESPLSRKWALPAGFFSGILSGAFNTGGPPVVLYGTERKWNPHAFRGNIQGFFAPVAGFTLTLLALKGAITKESLTINAQLLPFLLAGMVAGDRFADQVEEGAFRKILLVSLLLVGVSFSRSFFAASPL